VRTEWVNFSQFCAEFFMDGLVDGSLDFLKLDTVFLFIVFSRYFQLAVKINYFKLS